jgi:hypothetical protein
MFIITNNNNNRDYEQKAFNCKNILIFNNLQEDISYIHKL